MTGNIWLTAILFVLVYYAYHSTHSNKCVSRCGPSSMLKTFTGPLAMKRLPALVLHRQRFTACDANLNALPNLQPTAPSLKCFMSKQLGLLHLDTREQFQLELRSHIQQAIADGKRIAKGLHFPVVYQMINSSLKAF